MQAIIKKWNELSEEYPSFSPLVTTFLALIGIIVIFYAINPRFLSPFNIRVILTQSSAYLVLVVGMTLVITTAGIDISIGSMTAVVGVLTGYSLVTFGLPVWLAVAIAMLAGFACGLLNAVLISRFQVPAIIITLGTMTLFRGLAYVLLEHRVLFGFPASFLWLGRGRVLGLPPAVYIAVAAVLVGQYLLNSTATGRHIIAVGCNEQAARLSGVNIAGIRFLVYLIMGLTTAIASMIWLARLNAAQAGLGYGVEFHTIAAVVLGGTSLFGGKGLMLGSAMGALILGFLENGLVTADLPYFWRQVMLGLIFIIVVTLRTLQTRGNLTSS